MSDEIEAKAANGSPGAGDDSAAPAIEAADATIDEEFETKAPEYDGPNPELRKKVVDILRTIYDPEIPVNIFELGLIYTVDVNEDDHVAINMTLTSPACPVAGSLPPEVEYKAASVEGVKDAKVEVVWDPPWTPDMMSEVAKLELNMW